MSKWYEIVDEPGVDMTEMWDNLIDDGSLVAVEPDIGAASKKLKGILVAFGIEMSNEGAVDIHDAVAEAVVNTALGKDKT